ncbi:MAG TPA: 3-methyl-2-oxobutanoate hydroxymethyltransferase [bacterium]|nr:3-methyl-2-oxobutanoate hydroxymethyltransferase [bacterium]
MNKITVNNFIEMKNDGDKIISLTAYDYTFATLMDQAGVDLLLVGDSCGNVIAGHQTTIPVELDDIIYHTRAVQRGTKRAFVVADMPFMSFQESPLQALHNAGRLMQKGRAEAVKLEGGQPMAETIKKITDVGIPVLGHLGLTPQSVHALGGYRVQGAENTQAKRLKQDAKILQEAGVFAIVLEKIPAKLAGEITESVDIPTIGIGAGPDCDGQILVSYDMLGLNEKFNPKFLRKYADLAGQVKKAVKNYAQDVKVGDYPSEDESY